MSEWARLFDEAQLEPPATEDDLRLLQDDLSRPLSEPEAVDIVAQQSCPWPVGHPYRAGWVTLDPRLWKLPDLELPSSYLSFLRWSNGPWVRSGDRECGSLATGKVREYMLAYHFPHYMPAAVPLGLDGGGVFAVFDGRQMQPDNEYAILSVHAGNLGYHEARVVGTSFTDFCLGTTPIDEA